APARLTLPPTRGLLVGMTDEDAFRAAVLAQPFEHGPRLVWADALDERGDPRGAWLRHWYALEAAALAIPSNGPAATWGELELVTRGYPGDRSLLAAVMAALAPTPEGPRARDLHADGRAARALTTAALAACGLAGHAELAEARQAARDAKVAIPL